AAVPALEGGALKTCSSMAKKQCVSEQKIKHGKQQLSYRFSLDAQSRWQATDAFNAISKEVKQSYYSVISTIYSKSPAQTYTRSAFLDRLDNVIEGTRSFTGALDDDAYYALLDTHEVFQLSKAGDRLTELVSVPQTKSAASIDIYAAFVKQAKLRKAENRAKPTIAVITASSRDYFESADFYEGAFRSLGADVTWLPLSGVWQMAQYINSLGGDGCGQLAQLRMKNQLYDRERIYPKRVLFEHQSCQQSELIMDVLNRVDGVFFNGGDQSKTLAALLTPAGLPSEALNIITQRNQSGHIIVGGTSAGTAVQAGGFANGMPVPMLTNGASASAITRGVFAYDAPSVRCSESVDCIDGLKPDDVTYRAEGGLGLFNIGLLDTHFSERNRETRLIMSAFATQQDFAFGVDETTALLVSLAEEKATFEVIGENGVFIADLSRHEYQQLNAGAKVSRQLGATAHYLPTGTKASLTQGEFNVKWPKSTTRRKAKSDEDRSFWRQSIRLKCKEDLAVSWTENGVATYIQAAASTTFFKTKGRSARYCGYSHLPFVISTQ
ncbi:MAG: cyanophycinase, partial [Pseudomonadota bacterium]